MPRRLWLAWTVVIAAAPGVRAADQPLEFARDVQPLLKARCYECHDGRKQKAGYRLDVQATALRGGESGVAAIVPGKPGESELVRRITSRDGDERMPPQGDRLSDAEVNILRRWIESGALWPKEFAGNDSSQSRHWAFRPPVRPAVPAVKNASWLRNEIDRFILAKLETVGWDEAASPTKTNSGKTVGLADSSHPTLSSHSTLTPSPEADRVTLVRRLFLDLIGLPPTPEEVDAYFADNTPEADTHLVERLLASPHYGERWGRLWLDAARYADSDGFEKDKPRFVWFYRDYVINALNRDLPYDQFIREQIAGDLLPHPSQDQVVATGFLRNSMINEEGGVDPEQFRMEAMFDRMDAVGKGILGLTIQCAQCHNHKYDPLTQLDYYRMFAYLNDSHEANVPVYTPVEQQQRADIFRQIAEIEALLKERTTDWKERLAAWEAAVAHDQPEWTIMQTTEDDLSGGQKMYRLKDGSYLCQGYAPTKHTVTITVNTQQQNITAFRLEQLNDPNLPLGGPGRSIAGTSALTEFKVRAKSLGTSEKERWVKFVRAISDANPPEKPLNAIYFDKTDKKRITGPVESAIDGKDETAWSIDVGPGRRNEPCQAVFVAESPITYPEGGAGLELQFHLVQNHGGWNSDDNQNNNLGRFRLAITSEKPRDSHPWVSSDDVVPLRVRELFAIPAEQRSPAQQSALFSYWRKTVPEWKAENERIEDLWKQHPEGASQLVLMERDQPRMTHLLKRGDFLKPADPVTPGVPEFLGALSAGGPANRLAFANWLADRKSPTTARALVNRVWQAYFGNGLVATSEDLGTQCEPPSHPELLDWLAVEFMDRGWSQKELHRLIVHSATYRQSSRVTDELKTRDPFNRLLARGPRFRVDAEVVRDIALAASGLLNRQVGGPSVHPPLPEFMLLPPVSYGPKTWKEDQDANRYRRALYTFRFRSLPYPVLQTFDAPNGDFACVRRSRSNTPLQALMTLNEPVFLECAQGLAATTLKHGGDTDEKRLNYAFRRCVSRPPTQAERSELLTLLRHELEHFAQAEAQAKELTSKELPGCAPPEGATAAQLAAWTVVSRVLLNLDEAITKE